LKIGISLQAKMTKQSPEQIAAAYRSNYESLWNSDRAASVATLYAPDSLLIGYAIAVGQGEIEKLLETLFTQGWTRISNVLTHIDGAWLAAMHTAT
jgi:hypothetical protein